MNEMNEDADWMIDWNENDAWMKYNLWWNSWDEWWKYELMNEILMSMLLTKPAPPPLLPSLTLANFSPVILRTDVMSDEILYDMMFGLIHVFILKMSKLWNQTHL